MKAKLATIALALMLSSAAYAQDAKPPAKAVPAAKAPAAKTTLAPTPPATKVETKKADPVKPTVVAKDGEKQKWWQGVLVTVIEAVLAFALPILATLLGLLLRKMKLNVEREKLEWVLGKATGYGEQALRKKLKDGKEPDYDGVKAQAKDIGYKLLVQQGLAKKWGEMLSDMIEAKLGQSKLEGVEAPKPEPKPATS